MKNRLILVQKIIFSNEKENYTYANKKNQFLLYRKNNYSPCLKRSEIDQIIIISQSI